MVEWNSLREGSPLVYELFEHTADLGLRVAANSFEELLAEAAHGLAAMVILHPERLETRATWVIEVRGTDPDYLLFDWLHELLIEFERSGRLPAEVNIELTMEGLRAVCHGEPFEDARHFASHEVKAITYHGLSVVEEQGHWRAEVIVDI